MNDENKNVNEPNNGLLVLKDSLLTIVDNIDSGNSQMDEKQIEEILMLINFTAQSNVKYSKYQALNYLGMKRSTFDLYVSQGLIPKGRQQAGFKEIFWLKSDLDKYKNESRVQE